MSICDNETKIYPGLKPTAPQEPQSYRLNKLSEIEAFFLDEIGVCDQIHKKMKRFNTILGIVETGLILSMVSTGGIYIEVFASGIGLPKAELAYFFLLQLPSHKNLLKSSP